MAITITVTDTHGGIAAGEERVLSVNGDRDEIVTYGRVACSWQGLSLEDTDGMSGASAIIEVLAELISIAQEAPVNPALALGRLHRLGRPPFDLEA